LDITADLLISILAHACTLSFIHVGLLLQTGFLSILQKLNLKLSL